MARGHHPVAHLGVHPGELHALLATVEQAVGRIDLDLVAGASQMPFHDLAQRGIKLAE